MHANSRMHSWKVQYTLWPHQMVRRCAHSYSNCQTIHCWWLIWHFTVRNCRVASLWELPLSSVSWLLTTRTKVANFHSWVLVEKNKEDKWSSTMSTPASFASDFSKTAFRIVIESHWFQERTIKSMELPSSHSQTQLQFPFSFSLQNIHSSRYTHRGKQIFCGCTGTEFWRKRSIRIHSRWHWWLAAQSNRRFLLHGTH